MANYKVLQDIEAEDKFLGPLTLKQFIFGGISAICLYISVYTLTRGIWIVTLILLPIIVTAGFLAWPFVRDQPTEVWLLAKIRFFFKPHRRVWDQSGQAELVTITAPKKIEQQLTDNLSQTEVKSRLQALANTIDSRGWAVKNVNVNLSAQPAYGATSSDRLVDASSLPQEVSNLDVGASDDILDAQNNPVAAHLDQLMNASVQAHRQEALQRMKKPANKDSAAPDYWFMNAPEAQSIPASMSSFGAQTLDNTPAQATASPSAEDMAALARIKKTRHDQQVESIGHTKVIQPIPSTPDPAILGLAINDDLNVATIARQANKDKEKLTGGDEVVISLR